LGYSGRLKWLAGIVEQCTANPIQILTFIGYTLGEYYSQVKNGGGRSIEGMLPFDVTACCPICAATGCAELLGCYHRQAIDEYGTYYKAFPIARFECHGLGNVPVGSHRTFSLLPYQLIPYVKYSLPFIIKCLKSVSGEGHSVTHLLDYLAEREHEYMDLSRSSFYHFRTFVLRCVDKMLAVGVYRESEELFQCPASACRLHAFIRFAEEFTCHKTDSPIRGPCALGYDFYLTSGRYFLFGTPSHHR